MFFNKNKSNAVKRNTLSRLFYPLLGGLLLLWSSVAWSIIVDIDLNTFTAEPVWNVDINASGNSATFYEDPFISPISLQGDLFIQDGATNLSFDYSLQILDDWNEDYFDFYFNDLTMPEFSVGGVGDVSGSTYEGTYTLDVSTYAGSTVDMIFAMAYGFADFDFTSVLTISNLTMEVADVNVPEPGALALMLTSFPIIWFASRRRRFK